MNDSNISIYQSTKTCVIIPTYNNEKTVASVIDKVLAVIQNETKIIVVNDGSTDSTHKQLQLFQNKVVLVEYKDNVGKGNALRKGFKKAIELGYNHALTIDSDGQHYPEDIPLMMNSLSENPGNVIMGSRNMNQSTVPGKSSFGNRFSNFWFYAETFIKLPDTQTGFRIYPLEPISKMKFFTTKFELEIEIIVRLAWKGVRFNAVPIRVLYDPEERVSHFRPGRDFFRISVLNTVLVTCALLYHHPKRLFSKQTFKAIKEEAIKPQESNLNKALSLGFGCFMGIIPIWGFQLLIGIPLAVFFKLNKVLFITSANISIPPMIPLVIYTSFLVGQQVIEGAIDHGQIWSMSTDNIQDNVIQYVIGAIILAGAMFIAVTSFSYILLKIFRKEPVKLVDKKH